MSSPDFVAFLDQEVLPALFTCLDVAFPEFGWRRDSSGWVATKREHTKSLPGGPRPERVVCHWASGFFVYGEGYTAWTTYVNGGTWPTREVFREVVKKLADLAGVNCPEREWSPEELKRAEERDRRASLLETFWGLTRDALEGEEGAEARDYLERRGLSAAAPGLGFLPSVEKARADIKARGFSNDEVTASGVLNREWEGRLIIPWRDRWGNLATFAARALPGKKDNGKKYLYLAGVEKAPLVAFGLDVALHKKADPLVLLEGLLDVVNLQALGFLNVAAIGGAGGDMTSDKWERLAAFGVSRVVLALDNDEPGRAGILKALENVRKVRNGGNVPVVDVLDPDLLAPYKDPDELVHKEGLDAFRALLAKREPASLYLGRDLLGTVTPESSETERQAAARKVVEMVNRGGLDAVEVWDLLSLVEERTSYPLEALEADAKTYEERRVQEEGKKNLARVATTAAAELNAGGDLLEVAAALGKAVDAVKVKTVVDEPPPFSVDRLDGESREAAMGRKSGWDTLDRLEVSFNPGELAVLAARTGHGKTSALVGLLRNWTETAKEDETFLFYSMEEPEVRIYHRLLALLAPGTPWSPKEIWDHLRDSNSRENSAARENLDAARAILRQWEGRLLVVHRAEWDAESIAAHARKVASRRNVAGVFVDYLQRIRPPEGRYDRRDIEVSAVSRIFKALAVGLGAPVVMGAQVNRDAVPDKYGEKIAKAGTYEAAKKVIKKARPDLSHLREGGAEQEADLVLGLLNYAADYRTDEDGEVIDGRRVPDVSRLEVGTLKNRYGIPGRWAALAFEGRVNLIRDPSGSGEV